MVKLLKDEMQVSPAAKSGQDGTPGTMAALLNATTKMLTTNETRRSFMFQYFFSFLLGALI
jgi:hypothetical protein